MDPHPTLQRVAVTALVIAGLSNVLLWRLTADDAFANVVAVASLASALMLVVAGVMPAAHRWREEALLVAFAVWSANVIEFALETDARWESRVRQAGLYTGYALLALGTYLALRVERERAR